MISSAAASRRTFTRAFWRRFSRNNLSECLRHQYLRMWSTSFRTHLQQSRERVSGSLFVMMASRAELSCEPREDGALVLRVAGPWHLQAELPPPKVVEEALSTSQPRRIVFDATQLGEWDSGLLAFLVDVTELCRRQQIEVERAGLPSGVQRLLALAEAVPERKGARRAEGMPSLLERVGTAALEARGPIEEALGFLGEATIAVGRFVRGRARYRNSDLLLLIQQAGAQALGIITLISFLVGTILAFVGAVQLRQFGAEIYVADLVGIAMVREMGAMMTGIVMAGRTGAAFAAQLGTMKVTQEIDALTTMGISPLEFLVLPRMI